MGQGKARSGSAGRLADVARRFYIYHLAHFAKHFYEMGSGIRSVMDIYVYLRAFGKEMDIRYIERELKTLELYEFGKQMRNLSLFWFSPHSKDSSHPADRDFEEIQKAYLCQEFTDPGNLSSRGRWMRPA